MYISIPGYFVVLLYFLLLIFYKVCSTVGKQYVVVRNSVVS